MARVFMCVAKEKKKRRFSCVDEGKKRSRHINQEEGRRLPFFSSCFRCGLGRETGDAIEIVRSEVRNEKESKNPFKNRHALVFAYIHLPEEKLLEKKFCGFLLSSEWKGGAVGWSVGLLLEVPFSLLSCLAVKSQGMLRRSSKSSEGMNVVE